MNVGEKEWDRLVMEHDMLLETIKLAILLLYGALKYREKGEATWTKAVRDSILLLYGALEI